MSTVAQKALSPTGTAASMDSMSPTTVDGMSVMGSPTEPVAFSRRTGEFPTVSPADLEATLAAALTATAAQKAPDAAKGVASVLTIVEASTLPAAAAAGLITKLSAALTAKAVTAREGALKVLDGLVEAYGVLAAAYVLPRTAAIFDATGHKNAGVRAAAAAVLGKVVPVLPECALPAVVSEIVSALKMPAAQVPALELLSTLAGRFPGAMADELLHLVPEVMVLVHNPSPPVKAGAEAALAAIAKTAPSRDVIPFIPELVSCSVRPAEATETIFKLAATTFVQETTAPTLSLLEPVIFRALQDGKSNVVRMCAVIVENMCKLVVGPSDASVFIPRVLPRMRDAVKRIPNPEARQVLERAIGVLITANGESEEVVPQRAHVPAADIAEAVVAAIKGAGVAPAIAAVADEALKVGPEGSAAIAFVSSCLVALSASGNFEADAWDKALGPVVAAYCANKDAAMKVLVKEVTKMAQKIDPTVQMEDDDDAPDLCNCVFSLAYGSKVLLRDTRLHLKRGRRYALVGPNGSGKSTLMKSIVAGQIDGFPSKDELRTVFVECDISPDLAEMSVLEFVQMDEELQRLKVTTEQMREALLKVQFSEVMVDSPVSRLSGGWRMKLALARAMLKNADILLLDEPTNHLDVANVAWVLNYLKSLTDVTSILVSHDAKFLDECSTDVIQCDHMKLKNYRGNVSAFVKMVPAAKAYQELKASSTLKFTFPEPSPIHGLKTKGRRLLTMSDVEFTYPNTERKILHGVSIIVSQLSRCAVIGPNGAGKSTMIKLLTGEMEATIGTVWRHPALKLAYVAQHAFHHIENHLTKSPSEYIRWRYEGGIDKEAITKGGIEITDADLAKMHEVRLVEKKKHRLMDVVGRRLMGKRYVYECKWEEAVDEKATKFQKKVMEDGDPMQWISRDKLETWGWGKVVQNLDLRAEAGHNMRALSTAEVEKHLAHVGLEKEFANFCRIEALSMSQRVKVVLAAATWDNPHVIVLDEPTNYLDRESLGALADAIRVFGGGVVMISHNDEFTSALCSEQWAMKDGKLTVMGEVPQENEGKVEGQSILGGTTVDRFGNDVKAKAPPKELMTRKEKMRRKKLGIKDSDDESD